MKDPSVAGLPGLCEARSFGGQEAISVGLVESAGALYSGAGAGQGWLQVGDQFGVVGCFPNWCGNLQLSQHLHLIHCSLSLVLSSTFLSSPKIAAMYIFIEEKIYVHKLAGSIHTHSLPH